MASERIHFPMATTGRSVLRLVSMMALGAALTACAGFDPDLRDLGQGFDTTDAVRSADRPQPDDRGVITYPNYQVVVARDGDTVASVASRLGINADQLARENNLPSDASLNRGEILRLPVRVSGSPAEVTPVQTEAVQTSNLEPVAAPEPVTHVVQRGETAYSIARRYDVRVQDLARWNGLDASFTLREGQTLLIPVANAAPPNRDRISLPGQGTTTPTPPSAAEPLPDATTPPVSNEPTEASTPAPAPEPDVTLDGPSESTARFVQPLPGGSIIRDYEPGSNEGLDIGGAPGSRVVAAESGSVAAITEDADGIPILVLRHSGGLLTVYANIANISVSDGASVSRGQQIATLRDTSPAYLHFEIRDGYESVDPTNYLR